MLLYKNFLFTRYIQLNNKRDISSLDGKHKHALENGAPPDEYRVLYRIT